MRERFDKRFLAMMYDVWLGLAYEGGTYILSLKVGRKRGDESGRVGTSSKLKRPLPRIFDSCPFPNVTLPRFLSQ